MASSYFINPNMYDKLSEGQICMWRSITYNNIETNHNFDKTNLLNLDEMPILSTDEIKDLIIDQLFHLKQIGKFIHNKTIFIMFDSCVLSNQTIPNLISKFKKDLKIQKTNIVIILSNIGMTENIYKMYNKKKYPFVSFGKLRYNMNILSGKTQLKMKNIAILNTDLCFDNKILIQEEKKYLKKNTSWINGSRNEINDNAQLQIMNIISDMFPKMCGYLLTTDKELLNKCECCNIFGYECS
jgi:hypothetical protein